MPSEQDRHARNLQRLAHLAQARSKYLGAIEREQRQLIAEQQEAARRAEQRQEESGFWNSVIGGVGSGAAVGASVGGGPIGAGIGAVVGGIGGAILGSQTDGGGPDPRVVMGTATQLAGSLSSALGTKEKSRLDSLYQEGMALPDLYKVDPNVVGLEAESMTNQYQEPQTSFAAQPSLDVSEFSGSYDAYGRPLDRRGRVIF